MKSAPPCDHFRMRHRDGSTEACPCWTPCPVCKGQGHRVTDDGARPACGKCGGRGWLKSEPFLPPADSDPAGTLPPPGASDAGRAALSCDDPEGGRWTR